MFDLFVSSVIISVKTRHKEVYNILLFLSCAIFEIKNESDLKLSRLYITSSTNIYGHHSTVTVYKQLLSW